MIYRNSCYIGGSSTRKFVKSCGNQSQSSANFMAAITSHHCLTVGFVNDGRRTFWGEATNLRSEFRCKLFSTVQILSLQVSKFPSLDCRVDWIKSLREIKWTIKEACIRRGRQGAHESKFELLYVRAVLVSRVALGSRSTLTIRFK